MITLLTLILLLSVETSASSYPVISVRGTLTCYGIPFSGTIMMFNNDDNLQGHIFTIRDIGHDGKFWLNGEKVEDLDVRLIIQHTCVDWKNGETLGWGPLMFSELAVNMRHFAKEGFQMDVGKIELSKLHVGFQMPNLFFRKGFLMLKRYFLDNKRRVIQMLSG